MSRVWLRSAVILLMVSTMTAGCFESEQPTCEYWTPKLSSATLGDKALQMVEELRCKEAIPGLGQMFSDGQYRSRILRILKQIGDRAAATPILKEALLAKDTSKLSASIISDWALSAARPELEQILTGTSLPKFRLEALEALLAFEKAENIVDLLIQLAGGDPNRQGIEVNKLAVEKLGDAGDAKAVDVLVQAAFLRDNAGRSIYAKARRSLAQVGPAAIPKLSETVEGKNEPLKLYARNNGLQDWQWRAGPEIVQLLTDTLDASAAPPVVKAMAREHNPPLGISPAMQEKWRVGAINRLKLSFLGLGHIGPEGVIKDLTVILKDSLADAVNQRLHSATALSLIGSNAAQEALIEAWHAETSDNFREPLLRPLTLGIDWPHFEAMQKKITTDKKALASERILNALKAGTVGAYVAALTACKTDTGCWIKKLDDENKHVVVKAAVMLMRPGGDAAAVRTALIKRFVNATAKELDIRRFVLMAITRVGGAAEGGELLKIARNMDRSDAYWQEELFVYGNWLKHKK